ncbi:MAG TPA: hypothetical protein VMW36_04320 [Patescibacteria group bacterium]|nr:hypothetical protein [Patescibacteria group bacterium]
MITIFLIASLAVNGLFGWYIYRIFKKYMPWSEDIDDLFFRLDEYHRHIKLVSEMETFYGDEILLNLLRHSHDVSNEVEKFRDAYSLLDDDGELLDEDELDLLEGEEDENEERATPRPIQGESLGVVRNRR